MRGVSTKELSSFSLSGWMSILDLSGMQVVSSTACPLWSSDTSAVGTYDPLQIIFVDDGIATSEELRISCSSSF